MPTRRIVVILAALFAAVTAAADRPAAPPPATRPATAPASRPAWMSVMFADPGDARRVVLVLDASRGIINQMANLKEELVKVISDFHAAQSFNLIFYRDGKAVFWQLSGPVPATPENQRNAFRFIEEIDTTGEPDPLPALSMAFDQQPDLVYLLCADPRHRPGTSRTALRLVRDRQVRVNAVALFHEGMEDEDLVRTLKGAARVSGGTFRRVVESREGGGLAVTEQGSPGSAGTRPAALPVTRPAARPSLPDLAAYASVVIFCDSSIGDALPAAKQAIEEAVAGMRPGQSFNIVFPADGLPDAMSETRLLPANGARKAQAARFVREYPAAAGDVQAWPAVRLALDLRPKAIVLIGDAWLPVTDLLYPWTDGWEQVNQTALHGVEVVPDRDASIATDREAALSQAAGHAGGTFHRVVLRSAAPERTNAAP